MRFVDRTGMRYGRLTVLYRTENNKHRHTQWVCKCDCGKECNVSSSNIGRHANSCGCYRLERAVETNSLRPYEALYRIMCRTSYHPVTITYEQFIEITNTTECHYCGAPITWTGIAYNLDRKDNNLGHTLENCVVCCTRCNRGKGAIFTYKEWREIGNLIRSWNVS